VPERPERAASADLLLLLAGSVDELGAQQRRPRSHARHRRAVAVLLVFIIIIIVVLVLLAAIAAGAAGALLVAALRTVVGVVAIAVGLIVRLVAHLTHRRGGLRGAVGARFVVLRTAGCHVAWSGKVVGRRIIKRRALTSPRWLGLRFYTLVHKAEYAHSLPRPSLIDLLAVFTTVVTPRCARASPPGRRLNLHHRCAERTSRNECKHSTPAHIFRRRVIS
jgi:hypothetical protein